jgi:aspartyl-tRNA(Asn)/glutamyl-tRNA(Gln) amidotransferase subunit C
MKISTEHLARLARLSLSNEEKELFGGQLDNILDYMGKLDELDTSNVLPTSHVISINNVVRDDLPKPSLGSEEALKNAPDRTDKFFRVPRIIE